MSNIILNISLYSIPKPGLILSNLFSITIPGILKDQSTAFYITYHGISSRGLQMFCPRKNSPCPKTWEEVCSSRVKTEVNDASPKQKGKSYLFRKWMTIWDEGINQHKWNCTFLYELHLPVCSNKGMQYLKYNPLTPPLASPKRQKIITEVRHCASLLGRTKYEMPCSSYKFRSLKIRLPK